METKTAFSVKILNLLCRAEEYQRYTGNLREKLDSTSLKPISLNRQSAWRGWEDTHNKT